MRDSEQRLSRSINRPANGRRNQMFSTKLSYGRLTKLLVTKMHSQRNGFRLSLTHAVVFSSGSRNLLLRRVGNPFVFFTLTRGHHDPKPKWHYWYSIAVIAKGYWSKYILANWKGRIRSNPAAFFTMFKHLRNTNVTTCFLRVRRELTENMVSDSNGICNRKVHK